MAGCLLIANSRSQRRLLSRQPQGTRVVNFPLVFRDLDLSDKWTVHHFNPNLSSRLYHAPNERLIRFTDQTRNRTTTDTRLEGGDLDGHVVWLVILRAIEGLQRTAPKSGEAVH